jgi:hypothetical protein
MIIPGQIFIDRYSKKFSTGSAHDKFVALKFAVVFFLAVN